METAKPLEFKGTASGYFVLALVSIVLAYIPILGWAFLLNYASAWFADNTLVNGKKVAYKATYSESLMFMLVNGLLLIVTLGIYLFWFMPKMYRYVVDHTQYVGEVGAAQPVATEPVAAPAMQAPVSPVEPVAPITPTEPTPPVAPTGTTPLVG
ncbi:MAG TPA: DUF898 family protein [Candidatus Saccharimonadia bacterium]|nr:DUF898 family protein [Candidatus Saccharimonadia bacterium]